MASIESVGLLEVIDTNIAELIVSALGGSYHALSLRATSRKFRELIPAPKHTAYDSDIARIMASLGNTDACIRALKRDGWAEWTLTSVATEAAFHEHRDLCKRLLDFKTWNSARGLMKGAAMKKNMELCADIVTWAVESQNWIKRWDSQSRRSFFDVLITGAVVGDDVSMIQFLRKRCITLMRAEPLYDHSLCAAARIGRADICSTIRDWMRADNQLHNVERAIRFAAVGGHEALVAQMSTWAPRDLQRVAVDAAQACCKVDACDIIRKLIKKESPRVYVDAVSDMMRAAIQKRDSRLFTATLDWIVDARGRAYTLEELRATLDFAMSEYSVEIAGAIRELMLANFSVDA